jgi:hypothetical protein
MPDLHVLRLDALSPHPLLRHGRRRRKVRKTHIIELDADEGVA